MPLLCGLRKAAGVAWPPRWWWLLWLVLLGAGFAPAAMAQLAPPPSAEVEQDLARVRDRIREVAKAFEQDVEARDQAVQALRSAEQEVAGARSRLDGVRSKLAAAERRQAQLAAEKRREKNALDAQRAALAGQLRAAYSTGRAESARLLLQSDDPGALPRLLAWYGYFGRARAEKISEIRVALERIEALDTALAAQQLELRALVAERAGEVGSLEEARRSRDLLVAEARAQVASRDAELKRLRRQPFHTVAAKVTDTLAMAREMFPGKANSLDALCRRLEVDNTHRTLHGALLDAGLLAEVYIRLTRGQDSLVIQHHDQASETPQELQARDLTQYLLHVIDANADELAAHEVILKELDKSSSGKTVWRATEAPGAVA